MAQSAEYPDLKWVPPRAFGTGRDGKAVRYIVIHYTAGAEGNTSAEDGAAYDQRRTDGTSAHYYCDRDSVVQCVLTKDRGNTARHKGNRLGIQYELCGTVQTRAQWLDPASLPTLLNTAKQVARDCKKYDIPARRLTIGETRRAWTEFPGGPRGIVGHVDCTFAYPEDGGDHTDPGTQFPWDVFLDMVRDELEGIMPITPADVKAIAAAVQNVEVGRSGQTLGQMIQVNTTALQALLVLAKMEAAEIPPSVQQVVDGIEAAFGTGSPEETAAALKAVLGDRAEQVGRLLAGQA
jgi:N-acetyl-anhydromuramyl-L-alanine amidase AmpD